MKTIKRKIVYGSLISLLTISLMACEKTPAVDENLKYATILEVADDGTSTLLESSLKSVFVETNPLTEEEIVILQNLKEEEKMARDVYAKLFEKWGSRVFANITKAENTHLNSVNYLLKYYGNPDTLIGEPGVFNNPDFLALYNELIEKGSLSIEEAMLTGALIEDMDISDINESLAELTNENIVMVLENLARGSRNHMRAFNRQLTYLDVVYSPVYISESDFMQIINSPVERGNLYKLSGSCIYN